LLCFRYAGPEGKEGEPYASENLQAFLAFSLRDPAAPSGMAKIKFALANFSTNQIL
jgi:hypothetical protein